jgi:deazaflavin-dependent oxidoreductase (nitroreductase family)
MNSEATSYNDKIVREFRAHAGHVGGEWAGTPLILVHHVGTRSGTERVTPLGYFPLDGGRYAIAASSGGSPQHPAWYHNLRAHPSVTVEVGDETFTAVAQELDDAARAELWPRLVARHPTLGQHQDRTTRQVPVFVLTRQN